MIKTAALCLGFKPSLDSKTTASAYSQYIMKMPQTVRQNDKLKFEFG